MAIVNASDDVTIPSDEVGDASYIDMILRKETFPLKYVLNASYIRYTHTMLSVRMMQACCGDVDSGLGELSREEDGDSFALWAKINDEEDKLI